MRLKYGIKTLVGGSGEKEEIKKRIISQPERRRPRERETMEDHITSFDVLAQVACATGRFKFIFLSSEFRFHYACLFLCFSVIYLKELNKRPIFFSFLLRKSIWV
jgi:hypothetical protein